MSCNFYIPKIPGTYSWKTLIKSADSLLRNEVGKPFQQERMANDTLFYIPEFLIILEKTQTWNDKKCLNARLKNEYK